MMKLCFNLVLTLIAAIVWVDVANAQPQISTIVGYGAGGGYDSYARLVGRHMGKYLAGKPTFITRNMPGAGGLKAANYLYSIAPKDGSVIGTFSQSLGLNFLTGLSKIDFRRFTWIGSLADEVKTCVFSTSSAISSWNDMLTKPHAIGGQTPGAENDVMATLLINLFHTRSKLVTGYHGMPDFLLAIERKEIDGICGVSYASMKNLYPDYLRQKKVKFIVYASSKNSPEMKDIPNIFDLAKGAEQRSILNFIFSPYRIGRPFAAPPGLSDVTRASLRAAFMKTMTDQAFLADAEKLKLRAELTPNDGGTIDRVYASLYSTPADLVQKALQSSGMKIRH